MENLQPQNERDKAAAPRLGFHEIVPGYDNGQSPGDPGEINIPEFDLSQHLLVDERRASSSRRQGPAPKSNAVVESPSVEPVVDQTPVKLKPDTKVPRDNTPRISAYRHPVIQSHAIVADIVRRDIQRLCMGQETAG
jgi:hypothetical protein